MKHLVVVILAAGSLPAHSQTAAQSQAGETKGIVTDKNGSPVSAATV
jgi:hypothetical protein